jgi:hypothetical protein
MCVVLYGVEIALQTGEFYPNRVANTESDCSERDNSEGGLLRYPVVASPYYNGAHCIQHDQEDMKGEI